MQTTVPSIKQKELWAGGSVMSSAAIRKDDMAEEAKAQNVRLIKKYPNRRLYDTKTSSYITLADVKELVLKTEEFHVVDAKTGDDLTRSILLQIILDEEAGSMPMLTSDLLSQMIRFYGNAMQGMMGNYLEQSKNMFLQAQEQMSKQTEQMLGAFGIKRGA
jgi:polyhydroxyalkanoate synthesis repressor PhaR